MNHLRQHQTAAEAQFLGMNLFSQAKDDNPWRNTGIGKVKNGVCSTCHTVSARRLSRYLGEFCYRFNCRFQLDAMVDRLATMQHYNAADPPAPADPG
ncbi:MAG: hypothetical protein JZU50_01535 [Desulfobulbaceae bacterium]|nr:hypothetical protein [Desulfobulbaceae bacterium]